MERQTKVMEDLYCEICKDYTSHEDKVCTGCGAEYDENKRRVIVCGAQNHPDVIKAMAKLTQEDPEVIIIPEEVALLHKLGGSPTIESQKYIQYEDLYDFRIRDLHDDVPKWARGKKTEPVRNSADDPKIGRNEPCPCGSGKKYKKCCLNQNK